MPHFTLEHSANLDVDAMACLRAVNAALVATGHFKAVDIKSRAYRAGHFLVGTDPAPHAFVAGRLAVLPGRSDEVKAAISAAVLQALLGALPLADAVHRQVSVEIVDLHRESYAKQVQQA
jgi:5-carboxymethyl-2-hydroxymuconate isomerase